MHFPSGAAGAGSVAQLESRLLYPKRGYQCLQFFYYNSAAAEDTLSVWVREYDAAHSNGTLRLIKTIDGGYQSPSLLFQSGRRSNSVQLQSRSRGLWCGRAGFFNQQFSSYIAIYISL